MLPLPSENGGGAAEKTLLRYSLCCVYFHTFSWESKPRVRKDEERSGRQLLADEQPASCIALQGIGFVSCLLFSRECSNLEAFQLSAN